MYMVAILQVIEEVSFWCVNETSSLMYVKLYLEIRFVFPYDIGIDTSKSLLDEMRKEKERESAEKSQTFLLEPLLALTGSLTLTQTEPVSNLHKCDIPTHLYLSSKLGLPEAILWLYEPLKDSNSDDDGEENSMDESGGWMGSNTNMFEAINAGRTLEWSGRKSWTEMGSGCWFTWRC